jgi:VWFA-related protein
MKRFVSLLTAIVAALGMAAAQTPQRERGDVELSAGEVLMDLVVTDKKGRPVVDLKPTEIEVYENGQRQQVTSFGLVRSGPQPPGLPGAPAPASTGPEAITRSTFAGLNLIMIVVDRTSVTQGNLVQIGKAAETFVNDRLAINDLVAVFVTTNRPVMLQNFTNNKPKLVEAIKKATAGTSVSLAESLSAGDRALAAEIQGAGPITDPAGTALSDAKQDAERSNLLDANARGIDTAFTEIRDQFQALTLINAVVALTKVYSNVPGRKSMVLYSEGFVVDNNTDGAFEAMIGAANRANFTINTVSAGGLLASEPTGNVLPRRGRPIEESEDRMLVSGGESGMDRILKPNLVNNDEALSRLAKETGGVLVRNTNDLGKGFEAIANDLRSYYALSYAPTNVDFDGTFRTIDVKVTRPNVEVRARKGYYAVPGGANSLMLPFESPVLALISTASATSRPADLKVAMRTERFPEGGAWRVPVILSVDGGGLTAAPREKKEPAANPSRFEADAVVLVRDSSRAVVARLGRASLFAAPSDRMQEFRSEMLPLVSFPQPLVLAPGSYTLQIGVYDPNSKKGTVIERKIMLPPLPASDKPALSSLVLARVATPVAAEERAVAATDPLVVDGKLRVVPNATAIFSKSKGDRLIFYFRLHAPAGAQYDMLMHFMAGEQVLVGTPPTPLTPVDAKGYTSGSPVLELADFKPGTYRAVLYIVLPGTKTPVANVSTTFTVEP